MSTVSEPRSIAPFEILEFEGLRGCRSICAVSYTQLHDGHVLAIFGEVPHNPGTSVTNAIETLVQKVVEMYVRAAEGATLDAIFRDLIFVEHYPPRANGDMEREATWDLVRVQLVGRHAHSIERPSWTRMDHLDWLELGVIEPEPDVMLQDLAGETR